MQFEIEDNVLKSVYWDSYLETHRISKTVIVPEGVTKIEKYAIPCEATSTDCSVKRIILPDSVTEIEELAFATCYGLKFIRLPLKLKVIRAGTFSECYLRYLRLPEHLEIIEEMAFAHNELRNIYIPETVTMIEDGAFVVNPEMENIYVSPKNRYYTSIDGVLYDKNAETLICCPAQKTKIEIPKTVRCISPYAFHCCEKITEIELPKFMPCIEESTFYWCSSLKEIKLPETIEFIGESAFSGCSSLKNIWIPNHVKSIGVHAFSGCTNLKSIHIPGNIKIDLPKIEEEYDILRDTLLYYYHNFDRCNDISDEYTISLKERLSHKFFVLIFKNDSNPIWNDDHLNLCEIEIYFPEGTFHICDIHNYERAISIIKEKNYDISMDAEEKYFLLWQIYAFDLHGKKIEAYIEQHFNEMSPVLIKMNNVPALRKILQEQQWVTSENINPMILQAINEKKTEMQLMLVNYKYQHFEFGKNWKL